MAIIIIIVDIALLSYFQIALSHNLHSHARKAESSNHRSSEVEKKKEKEKTFSGRLHGKIFLKKSL